METLPKCPTCGALVSANAAEGLCPACLFRGALDPHYSAPLEFNPGAPGEFSRPSPGGGLRIGDYELLTPIASGGMGTVWRACQPRLNRVVALKMIREGHHAGPQDVRRFRVEAEAVARLDHPNIVPIYEFGEDDGRHFFTMKYIEGRSLAEGVVNDPPRSSRADDWPADRIATVLAKVARAVHFAHERGILHRDLKPANILLDVQGEPYVTDFGLAKLLPAEVEAGRGEPGIPLTLTGQALGTPAYMAPEQAAGPAQDLTTAADVYSLGAILFHLLTGRVPFAGATPLATLRQVVEQEPPRPSKLNALVDRDLETVCLKCLEKAPSRRYPSALALAEDLERWQRGESVLARSSNIVHHGIKWVKRHPAHGGLIGLTLLAPAVIITLLLVTGAELTRERNLAQRERSNAVRMEGEAMAAAAHAAAEARRATEARAETRQNLYAADMLLAQHALDDGNLGLARSLIRSWQPPFAARRPNGAQHQTEGQPDLRGFEWRYLWEKCQGNQLHTLHNHSNAVYCVAFSPDGAVLASGDDAGLVQLWDAATRRPLAALAASNRKIQRLSFSSDSRTLATADVTGLAKVWDLGSRRVLWSHQGRNPDGVQLSPVGTRIGVSTGPPKKADANTQYALVIDWTTGEELLRIGPGAGFESFSPDGKRAYVIRGRPAQTEVWDLAAGHVLQTFLQDPSSITVSPNGRHFARAASEPGGILLVDLEDHKPAALLRVGNSEVLSLAFSPDGTLLASAESGQVTRIWDVATQRETARLLGHVDRVTGVAFSPDGKTLVTSSADQTVMLWPVTREMDSETLSDAWAPYILSPDGRRLAGLDHPLQGNDPARMMVWDLDTLEATALSKPGEGMVPEFFTADSQALVARGEMAPGGLLPLHRWDLNHPAQTPGTILLNLGRTNALAGSMATADGSLYAVSQWGQKQILLWNPLTGEPAGRVENASVPWGMGDPRRFSPDGRTLVSHVWPNHFRLCHLAAPENVICSRESPSGIIHLTFSPDARMLVTTFFDHTIRLWDTTTLEEKAILSGHQEAVAHVAFSPDGATLASCGRGGVVKLWCWPARREVATLFKRGTDFCFVAFTPGGNTLLAGDWNGRVHFWRLPTLARIDETTLGAASRISTFP